MTRQDSYPRITGASVEEAPTAEASRGGDEVSLIDILTQLAYRKRLIAIVAGFAVLVGLILCFALPVRYTATAKIMPPQQTQSAASILMSQLAGSGAGSLAAMAGGGLDRKSVV